MAPTPPKPESASLQGLWTSSVQQALCVVIGSVLLILVGFSLGRSSAVPAPVVSASLDLNLARASDLQGLPGLGPLLAQRIVEDRGERGPFGRLDDLRRVPGIGSGLLDRVRRHLYVSPPPATASQFIPIKTISSPAKKEVPGLIVLNQATLEDLQKLPGIGLKLSQRILDYRAEKGRFAAVEDLRKVAGIGPKTLEKIRPFLLLNLDTLALDTR